MTSDFSAAPIGAADGPRATGLTGLRGRRRLLRAGSCQGGEGGDKNRNRADTAGTENGHFVTLRFIAYSIAATGTSYFCIAVLPR